MDLQSNDALLLEWYTLIKELDFVVRQQSLMVLRNQRPIDDLLREGQVSPHEQFDVPGGTCYTAVSKRRPPQQTTLQDGAESVEAMTDMEESRTTPEAVGLQSQQNPDSLATTIMTVEPTNEDQTPTEIDLNGSKVVLGPRTSLMEEHAPKHTPITEVETVVSEIVASSKSKSADMTLEDYALLPPTTRLKTLASQTTAFGTSGLTSESMGDTSMSWSASRGAGNATEVHSRYSSLISLIHLDRVDSLDASS